MAARRAAKLGRAAHLRRGGARRQPVRRGAAAWPEPTDGRTPHRRARGGAGVGVVRALAPRPCANAGGARLGAARRSDGGGRGGVGAHRLGRGCGRPRRRAGDREPRRRLRGAAADPRRVHAEHPGIAIELALTNRNEDLARRDADIAVRMVRPTQSALIARRIGASRIRLYAHRDYLARSGEPRSLADLKNHCVIGFDRDNLPFAAPETSPSGCIARISASAATATSLSSRRCVPASASAAARKTSRDARRSSSPCCRTRSSTRWKSGSPCTRI